MSNSFPDEFSINFNQFDKDFKVKIVKIPKDHESHPITSSDIYLIDDRTNQPYKYETIKNQV